jgi:hypothetical protein
MTCACPAWELAADTCLLKLQRLQNKVLHQQKFSKAQTGQRFADGFQPSLYIQLYNKIVQAGSESHAKS